jgi:hypothetical protein
MPAPDDVSHGDIYHKLGSLEGKVEALLLSLGERKSDIDNVFSRLRQIEHRVAWAMGAVVVISVLVPYFVKAVEPKIHFSAPPIHHPAR